MILKSGKNWFPMDNLFVAVVEELRTAPKIFVILKSFEVMNQRRPRRI